MGIAVTVDFHHLFSKCATSGMAAMDCLVGILFLQVPKRWVRVGGGVMKGCGEGRGRE